MIESSLRQVGSVHSVALKAKDDPGRPYSFQVYLGTDSENVPRSGFSNFTEAGVVVKQRYAGLEPDTVYNVYVVCSNDYPVFPEVLDDREVVSIEVRTEVAPPVRPLTLNSAAGLAILGCLWLF